jgi:hypothetical protein
MRPISTVTDSGNFTGATAHGSVDGTAPDTGDYWNGTDNATSVLEVLLDDLSGTPPGSGTCTVSIYEAESDTDVAPASGGGSPTYDIEVYEGATQRASRAGITATESTFTLDSALTFTASSITNWADVRVRFTSNGAGGSPANRRGVAASYIEISTPDASLDADVPTNVATVALTAQTATVASADNVTASTAAIALTGQTASVGSEQNVTANTATLALTAETAGVTLDNNVDANTASLALTAHQAQIAYNINIATASASIALTAEPVDINYGANADTALKRASAIGIAPVVQVFPVPDGAIDTVADRQHTAGVYRLATEDAPGIAANTASVALVGETAEIAYDVNINANTASIALTAQTSLIAINGNVNTNTSTIVLVGEQAEVASAGNVEIAANVATLVLVGRTASINEPSVTNTLGMAYNLAVNAALDLTKDG